MIPKIYDILIKEAAVASLEGEIPISAVIVKDNDILAISHNMKEKNKTSVAHAEIIALKQASEKLNNWRLDGCEIYISLEPCTMCASAIHKSRVDKIFYFVKRPDSTFDHVEKNSNKKTNIEYLDYGNGELQKILQDFFKNRR